MNKKIEEAVRDLADVMWQQGCEQSDEQTDKAIAECLAIIEGEMSKWISVKERLPEARQMVWTYSNDSKDSYGYMIQNGYWEVVRDGMERVEVTHWQPLPTPPEAKS